ncbi:MULTISPECIES: hypothetical protein [Pseudomonas]|uniref:Porin domain-containing protein n=1 Tax=Pseudomonas frederiksbergensis TaxID=104087 RepID=A0A6L5C1M5_9PSED|nr:MULTISPECIES: hypothetical protein [Pseudomonas]KAA8554013.1 hypothetical protein FX984_00624 [Pseudomonas marginalis]KAF2394841.1 hypothetical protein FX983_02823 [Pseudomonas frederiksbergensis]
MISTRVLSIAALCVASSPAFALDQGDYRFNGFGTLGVTHLGGADDSHGYGITGQTTDHWRGDQLSKLGGQLQYGITDTVGLTAQAIIKPQQDEWQGNLEWLYLSWQATDKLKFRVGRLGGSTYMYSETLNVGYTNPWIRLPDEVYSQVQISNYEGADFIYTEPLSFGSLTVQVSGGVANNRKLFILDKLYDADYKNYFAANATLAVNDFGSLRISYAETDVTSNDRAVVSTPFGMVDQTIIELDSTHTAFTSLGYQYDNGVWVSSDELTHRTVAGASPVDAMYFMGGRRFGDFLAHVTYGQMKDDSGHESSWTYGLNYNVTPSVVVKGEFKRVDTHGGTSGVFIKTPQETVNNILFAQSSGAFGNPSRNFDGDIFSIGVDFVF